MLSQGAYTKVAWVNRATGNKDNSIISGNTGHVFWAPDNWGFKLYAGHTGRDVRDPDALEIGEWYFVALTYDPNVALGTMILYKNGTERDIATGIAVQNESSETYIGKYGNGHHFIGSIDEAGIWDEALTSIEITALYNSHIPPDASSNSGDYTSAANLQGYWRFGENSGTTAYDLSGKGNHGIIEGATYSSPGASDITAPSTPTNLMATPGNTQVVLTWTANGEGDLGSYKVYGGTSASPTTVLSTVTAGTETFTHSSMTNGTLYYYNISAVDTTGNESNVTIDVNSLPHDPSGNYSLRFDGNDDKVNFGDIDALNTPTKMTVSFWFNRSEDKPDDSEHHSTSNVMYAKAADGNGNDDNIEIGTDGTKVEIYLDSGGGESTNNYDAGIQDSTWYHLAFTYNTADTYGKEGRLYINGLNVAEWDNWGGALDDASSGTPEL